MDDSTAAASAVFDPPGDLQRLLVDIRYVCFQHGTEALIMALTGDPVPESARPEVREAVPEIRQKIVAYLSQLGYWRANLHRSATGTSLEPWRPLFGPYGREHIFLLPFIDLREDTIRPRRYREAVEESLYPGERPTSLESFSFLKEHLSRYQEPTVVVRRGEIFLMLLLHRPEVLPVSSNPAAASIRGDGQYALITDITEPLNEALEWLDSEDEVDPTKYVHRVRSCIEAEREQLRETLRQIRTSPSFEDLLQRLKSSPVVSACRQRLQELPVRFRLSEPLESGLRAFVFWPVSGFYSIKALETRGEESFLYCLVALRPDATIDYARKEAIHAFVDSLLVHLLPAIAGQAVWERARSARSLTAYASLNHQFRNLVADIEGMLSLLPEDHGYELQHTLALLKAFSPSIPAAKALAEPVGQPVTREWGDFGKILAGAFSVHSSRSLPFTVTVDDSELRPSQKVDVRVLGLCSEVVRNAMKHYISVEFADRRPPAPNASLVLHLEDDSLCISCRSYPHDRVKAERLHKLEGWDSADISRGRVFIRALVSALGCPAPDPKCLWTISPDNADVVTVTFSCRLSRQKAIPA